MSTDRIVVAYATRHGQARRIAAHVARELETWGWPCDLVDVSVEPPGEWPHYAAAILVAPVHGGHHEKAMIRFVKGSLPGLGRIPNAFLSVTLTEASVEDPTLTPERHAQATADVKAMIEAFVRETGWRPQQVVPVAGALHYREYNPLIRFVMKQIARRSGGPTDTSRDYEFTDWGALGRFAQQFAHDLRAHA